MRMSNGILAIRLMDINPVWFVSSVSQSPYPIP